MKFLPVRSRPSLRRRLLIFLLIPMAVLLCADAVLTYVVALNYANRVHDRDLSDNALTLAKMSGDNQLGGSLTPQARFLLEYDPNGRSYFAVRSTLSGLLTGDAQLSQTARAPALGGPPVLYDAHVERHVLRAATIRVASHNPNDSLIVTVAETLRDRHQQAREILLLAIVMQSSLIVCVLLLVWFGVSRGLRALDPLTARLTSRSHELTPIDGPDVPQEIAPLTLTIDAVFGRLRGMLALHDRFIADAAHQLRTPLAGLSLHVDRALADPRPEVVANAMTHIHRLTQRTARTSSQLMALTRAQASPLEAEDRSLLNLSRLVPDTVSLRVHEALGAGVDLGYRGSDEPLCILGNASSVEDLLDNLIDNAMNYAGRGSVVTVSLQQRDDGGTRLAVEDNGPGVPPELLPRLSERFFRAPGNNERGTGLGLAIVQRIAERHHAQVTYELAEEHGLRVIVDFPSTTRGA
ncbi:sensor histidine kinase [Rhodanobacter sp. L36]|uniref:sensor histidine kinase n=1 Tax=Rhodanobacter sp. L36 TaxID=1747221 RepID=UPI00131E841E|nr:sensor histidine kinase [Rhodanobacter sp. L36]